MIYTYTKDYTISYSLIDCSAKLGLVELMNINQDMVTTFFGSIGSDNITLRKKNNAAWIYTKTKVKINDLPVWNTKAKAVSFITSLSPIRLDVETDFFGEKNNLLFAAKTEMCAIDFTERKIRKINTLEFPKDMEAGHSNFNEPYARMKLEFDSTDLVYSQKVFASDVDFTDHTNNVRYVKFLMNTLDKKFYAEKKLSSFEIQFLKESRDGDVLDIFRKETNEQEYSFEIKKGEESIIKAVLN